MSVLNIVIKGFASVYRTKASDFLLLTERNRFLTHKRNTYQRKCADRVGNLESMTAKAPDVSNGTEFNRS